MASKKFTLSPKETQREIIKCGTDPVYFINNYVRISHPTKGPIPFKTFQYQDKIVADFAKNKFNIVLKARQLGISTISAAYIVWLMLFHRDKNVLIMATKFQTAGNLVKKVKTMMKYVPPWLRIAKITVDNRTSFELSNGSQIKPTAVSADAGRSEALSLLVIDEAAFVDGLDELWTGLQPTLSTGGRCIAISTPNGAMGWFYDKWVEADQGLNDFNTTKLMWDVHPERDQAWYEKECRALSPRQIAQELECNFNMSGETVIDPAIIMRVEKEQVREPLWKTGPDRLYWIWEEAKPNVTYLMTADVARGDGEDYSTFHVIRVDTFEQVAEYKGKPSPEEFAHTLNRVGKEYNGCMMVVENNNIGFMINEKLKEMEYPNLYHSVKSTHDYVDQITASYKSGCIAGFTTTMKTRPLIIAKMEEVIRNELIVLRSSRLIAEMKKFVWHNGKPEAADGSNDDLILPLAIATWVRDTALVENKREMAYKMACIDGIMSTNQNLNTAIPGMVGSDEYKDHSLVLERDVKNEYYKEQARVMKEWEWLYKG